MADFDLQRSREQTAREQVGVTRISRATAWLLTLALLLLIGLVTVSQHIHDLRAALRGERSTWLPQSLEIFPAVPEALDVFHTSDQPFFSRVLAANRLLLREMGAFEDDLEDASILGQLIRPGMQTVLTRLGVGNEQAYVGRDGWLFYRPGLDYLTGPGFLVPRQLARRAAAGNEWQPAPQPDPRKALVDLHRQLRARDIELVVMPTPVKPMVHPEMFAAGLNKAEPLNNPSYAAFVRDLEQAGILVFDPLPILMRAKTETGRPQYLATDTHWRPEAMQLVARELGDYLRQQDLPVPRSAAGLQTRALEIAHTGDIATMLELPKDSPLFPPEAVMLEQVLDARDDFWRPDLTADVLLLGDSFTNIFSLEPMGWGEAAGLAEHLSLALQRPVDRIARNDHGAFATREILARELARGRDRLEGKRVVIHQFAVRELAVGDWKLIDLELGEPLPSLFFQPEPNHPLEVRAVVAAASPVPRPGSVPYADHILSLHLVDLEHDGALLADPQAVVYVWGMRDNVWTPAARLRPGDEVAIRLQAWTDVADAYDGINRSELDDFALQLEEPTWGEILE
ncbi:SGNH hydrolase-like domain-containing protein, acetyltransferase AlgX [Desulfonatronum zhilinae]|nr:SGNH hydrolase-like domain-containing protein, acetyltransferase AlgX [Desulfonatronum zhilinae]